MKPYKINSLVMRKTDKAILMIIDRRFYRYNNGPLYIQYTLIQPHRPDHQTTAGHEGIVPLEAS